MTRRTRNGQNPISLQAAIGSAIGISSVFLYSITKQYYGKLDADNDEKNKKREMVE